MWQNMLFFCLLCIRYNKSKKSAFGRTRILVRCDMQKVLAKGDEMNQRYDKCNSREAFIIVWLQHTLQLIVFRFGRRNSAQIWNILFIHKTIILLECVFCIKNLLDKLKLDLGDGDLKCSVFSPYTRPFFFNLCTYNTTGRDGINLWTVENEWTFLNQDL